MAMKNPDLVSAMHKHRQLSVRAIFIEMRIAAARRKMKEGADDPQEFKRLLGNLGKSLASVKNDIKDLDKSIKKGLKNFEGNVSKISVLDTMREESFDFNMLPDKIGKIYPVYTISREAFF